MTLVSVLKSSLLMILQCLSSPVCVAESLVSLHIAWGSQAWACSQGLNKAVRDTERRVFNSHYPALHRQSISSEMCHAAISTKTAQYYRAASLTPCYLDNAKVEGFISGQRNEIKVDFNYMS